MRNTSRCKATPPQELTLHTRCCLQTRLGLGKKNASNATALRHWLGFQVNYIVAAGHAKRQPATRRIVKIRVAGSSARTPPHHARPAKTGPRKAHPKRTKKPSLKHHLTRQTTNPGGGRGGCGLPHRAPGGAGGWAGGRCRLRAGHRPARWCTWRGRPRTGPWL